jgi:DNA-binding NarL/FixJ family response regulator
MRVLLATNVAKLDEFLKQQIEFDVVGEVPFKRPLIERAAETHADVLVLSAFLPGEEDIRELIYETQRASNCRIVYLPGENNNKTIPLIMDAFTLGVRDFVFDPIDTRLLIDKILRPSTYEEATSHFRQIPKTSKIFSFLIRNAPPVSSTPEISLEARELLRGIAGLLNKGEGKTIEETLLAIEDGISELFTENHREK